MFNFPLRRLLREQTPAQPSVASNHIITNPLPDALGNAMQSLLARFDDVLVKLDRIEAKIDLLPSVSMYVAPYLKEAAVRH